jgi:hypothetical protein
LKKKSTSCIVAAKGMNSIVLKSIGHLRLSHSSIKKSVLPSSNIITCRKYAHKEVSKTGPEAPIKPYSERGIYDPDPDWEEKHPIVMKNGVRYYDNGDFIISDESPDRQGVFNVSTLSLAQH